MKNIFLGFFFISLSVLAQKKDFTLNDIWTNNTFSTQGLEAFHSMKNGDYYTILNHYREGTFLEKYDYATLDKIETIVSGNQLIGIKYFDDYTFSDDETKLIIGVDKQRIFRRSWMGKYYVYDLKTKNLSMEFRESGC